MTSKKRAGANGIFNVQYMTLMMVSFLVSGSFYLVNTSLSAYAVSLGATLTMAGFIVGSFSVTSLIIRPFSGVLVNRMKKTRVLIYALVLMFLASVAYGCISEPALLILARVIHGVGFALYSTASLVLVSCVVPKERIGEGISYFGLAQMLATACMPSLGVWISETWRYQAVFMTTIVIFIFGGFCVAFLRLPEEEKESREEKKLSFGEIICVKLLPLGILGAFFSMFNGINSSFMLQLGSSRGIGNIALYFTVNTITIIVIRVFLGRLADRGTIYHVIIPASVSAVIAAILLGSASSLAVILFGAVFQAAGQGMAQPNLQAECVKRVEETRRGTASSTYYMCSDVGQGLGAIVGGALSERFGYGFMYYSVAAIFLLSVTVCAAGAMRAKKEKSTK